MKALQILAIILFVGFCSCNTINPYLSVGYNLKGPVKDVSEKSVFTLCDSAGSTLILDSTDVTIENYFFGQGGQVLRWEYFDKDSTLLRYDDYIYSSESGKFLEVCSYEKGELDYSVIEDKRIFNTLITKTFDSQTEELMSVFKIHYRHGLTSKIKSRHLKNNSRKVSKWKRDYHGNEIKVVSTSSYYSPIVEFSFFYLEFDTYGNWTQRYMVDFEKGDCYLVARRINYY